jgi:hypothetical protein
MPTDSLPSDDWCVGGVLRLVDLGPVASKDPGGLAPRVRQGAGSSLLHGLPHTLGGAPMTAFCTAGVDPIVAASPMPLAPSGFIGVGVSVETTSNEGSSAADGIA